MSALAEPADIYDGADPRELPMFSYAQVACWLKMPYSTLWNRARVISEYRDASSGVSFIKLYRVWRRWVWNTPGPHGRFEFDSEGLPTIFHPTEDVSINPRVQFGRPTTTGTGVTTSMLAYRVSTGETVSEVALDYGIDVALVRAAVEFEAR